MDAPLNIWCANIGWKWPDTWVYRLQRMVEQHCSIPYEFKCITDHDIPGVTCVPFSRKITGLKGHGQLGDTYKSDMVLNDHSPMGCWAKVDAWLAPVGTYNLILDLDIVILGDLAQLVSVEPAGCRDGRDTPEKPWLNGSCISWKSTEETQKVYCDRIPYDRFPRGEQEYVQEALGGFIPFDDVKSYKAHLTEEEKANPARCGVRVVIFHGFPTPASDNVQHHKWISETWEGLERIDRASA